MLFHSEKQLEFTPFQAKFTFNLLFFFFLNLTQTCVFILVLLLYLKWYFGSIKNRVVSSSSYPSRFVNLSLAENHEQQQNRAEQMKRKDGDSLYLDVG